MDLYLKRNYEKVETTTLADAAVTLCKNKKIAILDLTSTPNLT